MTLTELARPPTKTFTVRTIEQQSNAKYNHLLRWFVLLFYELQNLFCLFARWLTFTLGPPHKRLGRNSQRVCDFGGVLSYNIPIISQGGVLLFGWFHC